MTQSTTDARALTCRDAAVGVGGVALMVLVIGMLAALVPGFLALSGLWAAVLGLFFAWAVGGVVGRVVLRGADLSLTHAGAGRTAYVAATVVAQFVGALIGVWVALTVTPTPHLWVTPFVIAALCTAVDWAVTTASPALRG